MPKSANEVFREFVRFTGDGLPNEPGPGHGLPFGDPRTGVHNPGKSDLRDWAVGVDESADRAEAAAEVLEQVSDAIDTISGPADARKRFVVNAAGNGYTLAPRSKQFLLAYSQSNFANRYDGGTWDIAPPPNLLVWNGGNWNGDITPPLGNAFVQATTREPQVPLAYAAELARENPETDFYVVIIARGGTGIRSLAGIRYRFRTATTGNPASGDLRFNAGNSAIAYNETDLEGYTRFLGTTDLGTSTFYSARIQTTLGGGTSWATFNVNSAFVDAGSHRTQNIALTGSANWPPADGADVTVFPTGPMMRDVFSAIIPAAMTAAGLTGDLRKIDRLLIWPTEADVNYRVAYEGSDFGFILSFLAAYLTPATSILMTLPWPYSTGIEGVRSEWWNAIRRIAGKNPDQRTLVALDQTGAENWTDTNEVHVTDTSIEMLGKFMRRAEQTGGTDTTIATSGAYIPAMVGVANAGTITPSEAMWHRVGNVISVSGIVTILPVANGTVTEVGIPLPIPSEVFTHFVVGQAAARNFADHSAQIQGDPANGRATMQFTSRGVTAGNWAYSFSYRLRDV